MIRRVAIHRAAIHRVAVHRVAIHRVVAFALAGVLMSLAFGCGGSGGGGDRVRPPPRLIPPRFLLRYAKRIELLRPSRHSLPRLEEEIEDARGEDRVRAHRNLAVALLWEAEDARSAEEAAEFFHDAVETAGDGLRRRGGEDEDRADLSFVEFWGTWMQSRLEEGRRARRLSRDARDQARQFTRDHDSAGELLTLAWMARGEMSFENEDFDDAREAFRRILGSLEHPLYAYALYRSAHANGEMGEGEGGVDELTSVRDLGCSESAPPEVIRISAQAATELRTPLERHADGQIRPANCDEPREEEEERSDDIWRPEE